VSLNKEITSELSTTSLFFALIYDIYQVQTLHVAPKGIRQDNYKL